jgi:RHS repeat-associated protein
VTNSWDATRDVLTRKENMVGAAIISAYDYSVNPTGQRTDVGKTGSAFASNRSIAWGYDSLGQVTKADSSAGFDRTYQYDGIGNRKKSADSLTLPTGDNYMANALNQYTAVDAISPAYDVDGNATAYAVPNDLSANSTLDWDAENRLKSATVGTTTTTYYYDSGSRRIFQKTGSATTVYVYDGWNPVAEYTGTTLSKTYTWGLDLSGSLQGAGGVGGLLAVTDEAATGTPSFFPTFDGNGNVSEYLDATGTTVAHYEYDPFGRTTLASGTKAGDFAHRFSTKPLDTATGLYYYGHRHYDSAAGRWLSRDTIEERGGVNLYGFVGNDSVGNADRLGLLKWKNNAVLVKEDLFPYTPIRRHPGAEFSQVPFYDFLTRKGVLAITVSDWNVSAECTPCLFEFKGRVFDAFRLQELSIEFSPIVHMRPRFLYLSEAQRRWVTRAESDHWKDVYRWSIEARPAFQRYEDSLKERTYPTREKCEQVVAAKFSDQLLDKYKDVMEESFLKWDKRGLHNWENPNRRP